MSEAATIPPVPVADRVARLTEGQRQCLELVLEHKTSKDIARLLGISPHAVDMRIRTALRVLDVENRTAAALLLHSTRLAAGDYQPLIYQPPQLGHEPESHIVAPRPSQWSGTDGTTTTSELADIRTPAAWDTVEVPRTDSFGLPWGGQNQLSVKQRLFWIGMIVLSAAIALGSLVSTIEALKRLLRA